MKVKVTVDFRDKYTGKRHRTGDILEISEERYDEILNVGALVERINEDTAAETPKKDPKKAEKKAKK